MAPFRDGGCVKPGCVHRSSTSLMEIVWWQGACVVHDFLRALRGVPIICMHIKGYKKRDVLATRVTAEV